MSVASAGPINAYVGLDATTGGEIAGDEHLRQSIRDILSTPIGSRVMRRTYGSNLPDLVDAPLSPSLIADVVAASADAIMTWEPRVTLRRVVVAVAEAGRLSLDLVVEGGGRIFTLQGVL